MTGVENVRCADTSLSCRGTCTGGHDRNAGRSQFGRGYAGHEMAELVPDVVMTKQYLPHHAAKIKPIFFLCSAKVFVGLDMSLTVVCCTTAFLDTGLLQLLRRSYYAA